MGGQALQQHLNLSDRRARVQRCGAEMGLREVREEFQLGFLTLRLQGSKDLAPSAALRVWCFGAACYSRHHTCKVAQL